VTTPAKPDEPLHPDVVEDILGPKHTSGKIRKSQAYRNLTAAGITSEVANSIRQRASLLEKDPEKTRRYFKRALIMHALILDYQARNASDVESIKAASAGFIATKNAVFPKGPVKK
jgi:hypothetical protein